MSKTADNIDTILFLAMEKTGTVATQLKASQLVFWNPMKLLSK